MRNANSKTYDIRRINSLCTYRDTVRYFTMLFLNTKKGSKQRISMSDNIK